MKRVSFDITTDASGDGTATVHVGAPYLLYAFEWNDGDFTDGVDATLSTTNTASGVDYTILTLTNANDDDWYFPREALHDGTAGALSVYGEPLVDGSLRLVVSSGGSVTTGGGVAYLRTIDGR